MENAERFRLLGKYRTPRFRIGQHVSFARSRRDGHHRHDRCADSLADGKQRSRPTYADRLQGLGQGRPPRVRTGHLPLVRSVALTTVWKWRKALGVGFANEGTSRLFRDYTKEPWAIEALAKAQSKAGRPGEAAARSLRRGEESHVRRTSWRRCTRLAGDCITRRKSDSE